MQQAFLDTNTIPDSDEIKLAIGNGAQTINVLSQLIKNNNITNVKGTSIHYYYGSPVSIQGNDLTGSSQGIFLRNSTNYSLRTKTFGDNNY